MSVGYLHQCDIEFLVLQRVFNLVSSLPPILITQTKVMDTVQYGENAKVFGLFDSLRIRGEGFVQNDHWRFSFKDREKKNEDVNVQKLIDTASSKCFIDAKKFILIHLEQRKQDVVHLNSEKGRVEPLVGLLNTSKVIRPLPLYLTHFFFPNACFPLGNQQPQSSQQLFPLQQ